jgi:hypothetical protein
LLDGGVVVRVLDPDADAWEPVAARVAYHPGQPPADSQRDVARLADVPAGYLEAAAPVEERADLAPVTGWIKVHEVMAGSESLDLEAVGVAGFDFRREAAAAENHGQTPNTGIRVNAVELLHHQRGRDVPVGDDDLAGVQMRHYLGVQMVVPVSGVQASQGVAVHGVGQLADEPADRAVRRFAGDMRGSSFIGKYLAERMHGVALADAGWPVQ